MATALGSSVPEPTIFVAITGTLSQPRSEVEQLIDATANGQFVKWLTYQTHYLVCAKGDSQKAKKAARLGTAVISEAEMRDYLAAGRFPSTELPKRPEWHVNNFPEIEWTHIDPHELYLMTYCDARKNTTIRRVLAVSTGHTIGYPSEKWMGGFDGPQFKTFRQDRIVELEGIAHVW